VDGLDVLPHAVDGVGHLEEVVLGDVDCVGRRTSGVMTGREGRRETGREGGAENY